MMPQFDTSITIPGLAISWFFGALINAPLAADEPWTRHIIHEGEQSLVAVAAMVICLIARVTFGDSFLSAAVGGSLGAACGLAVVWSHRPVAPSRRRLVDAG